MCRFAGFVDGKAELFLALFVAFELDAEADRTVCQQQLLLMLLVGLAYEALARRSRCAVGVCDCVAARRLEDHLDLGVFDGPVAVESQADAFACCQTGSTVAAAAAAVVFVLVVVVVIIVVVVVYIADASLIASGHHVATRRTPIEVALDHRVGAIDREAAHVRIALYEAPLDHDYDLVLHLRVEEAVNGRNDKTLSTHTHTRSSFHSSNQK